MESTEIIKTTQTLEEFQDLDDKQKLKELKNSINELNTDSNSLLNEVLSKIDEWINKDSLNNDEKVILKKIKEELLKDENPFSRTQNLYALAM